MAVATSMSFVRAGSLLLALFSVALGAKVPFILIPGLTVPTLEAKFDVKSTPHFYCPKHSQDYKPIYLVTDDLLPGIRDCYISLMLLEVRTPPPAFLQSLSEVHSVSLQEHSGRFSNASGVDVRAPGFGLLSSMLYFRIAGKEVPIYRDFANNMTAAGWELDVTARGAPYDWRYDPGTLMDTGYAAQLQVCAHLPVHFPSRPRLSRPAGAGRDHVCSAKRHKNCSHRS
jgi:hypothetical protein